MALAVIAHAVSFPILRLRSFVSCARAPALPIYILSSFKPGLKGDVAAIVVITLIVSLIGILSAAAILMRHRGRAKALGGLLE
jgi:ABC-type spermidine/putrescine transport system permease subunit II